MYNVFSCLYHLATGSGLTKSFAPAGAGGMGALRRERDTRLDRTVAVI